MSTQKHKKIKDFFRRNESKLVLFLGILLVSTISFQLGTLQGQKWQQDPLIIEKVPEGHVFETKGVLGDSTQKNPEKATNSPKEKEKLNIDSSCAFIGSKKSDKYHKPSCRWAGQIKPDNLTCFTSLEDAKNRGYVPASCMK